MRVVVKRAKKKPSDLRGLLWYWATTYSPTCQGSTIGAAGLNFSVRNGKRWNPGTIATLVSRHTCTRQRENKKRAGARPKGHTAGAAEVSGN